MVETPAKPKPRRLPWPLVGIIFATICAAGVAAAHFAGSDTVPAAVSGAIVGLFPTLFGNRKRAALAIITVLAATWASLIAPDWIRLAVIIPVMALAVGYEAATRGTKTMAFAIIGWIILLSPAAAGVGWALLPVFAAAALLGLTVALAIGAEAAVPPQAPNRAYGVSLALALAIGLTLAFAIARHFENAHSGWIALMFAARAFDPQGQHRRRAFYTALAVTGGAACAAAALTLPVPHAAFRIAATALLLLGLRMAPAPGVGSAALISAAVILGVAPTVASAEFRIEAAMIAAALAISLSWLTGRIAARLVPDAPPRA